MATITVYIHNMFSLRGDKIMSSHDDFFQGPQKPSRYRNVVCYTLWVVANMKSDRSTYSVLKKTVSIKIEITLNINMKWSIYFWNNIFFVKKLTALEVRPDKISGFHHFISIVPFVYFSLSHWSLIIVPYLVTLLVGNKSQRFWSWINKILRKLLQ